MIKHVAPISGIAAWGNRYVATAGYDNQVILWESSDKVSLSRVVHDHLANQCEFSPDGRYLASSSSDYSARLWSVPDMRLCAVLMDHEDDVEGIAFHPVKPLIATSSRDTCVRVFEYSGRLLQRMHGHTADVISVGWLADSMRLVTSSDDGTIKQWDTTDGRMIGTIDLGGIETDTIAITPEGFIVAGNDEGEIIVIRDDQRQTHNAHKAGVKRIIYDRQARSLVSLSYDRSARFWHLDADGHLDHLHDAALPDIVWPRSCAYLNSDEVVFVTFGSTYATYNYRTAQWDLSAITDSRGVNGACISDGHLMTVGDAGVAKKDGDTIQALGSLCNFIIPFGASLIAGGQMGKVFDATTGECIHQHRSPLNCATVFEHHGRPALIVGCYTGEGIVLVLEDNRPIYRCDVKLHDNAVKGICFAAGQIFSVCATSAAATHDAESLEEISYLDDAHDKIANDCAALTDGTFVSVSRDLKLRLWRNGVPQVVATPHQNSIKCCAVSHSDRYVATGDYTGHVGIFDMGRGGYVDWQRPTAAGVSSLLPAVGEDEFYATSYDGQVYVVEPSAQTTRKAG